jgi:hypothetical protein
MERSACGACGQDLSWNVHYRVLPRRRVAAKPPGWLQTAGVWHLGPRARARQLRGAQLDYDHNSLVVDLPILLICPRCGERQTLDLHPRTNKELEAAYLRASK